MRYFSIKEIVQLTGIKAHTIRSWELRYHTLNPQRTATNIRCYSVEQLEHVLSFAYLLKRGLRMPELTGLNKAQLEERLSSFTGDEDRKERSVSRLMVYMFQEEIDLFEAELNATV